MPNAEVDLPERIDTEINRLVDQGDFVNHDEAYEQLISLGLMAMDNENDTHPDMDEVLFMQTLDDQQDPAL